MIDERESYSGSDVLGKLECTIGEIGLPETIRLDNSREFLRKDFDLWAFMGGVEADFPRPGKPTP